MATLYSLNVGDRVLVTLRDGQSYPMTISRIDAPGSMGTSYASGPRVIAHIRPGGYSVSLSGAEVAAWETLPSDHVTPAEGSTVSTPDGPGIFAGVTGALYAVSFPEGIPAIGMAAGSVMGYAPRDVSAL